MSVINFLCNIIWFLLAGIWLALGWALVGVVWCITIVGIPVDVQCFKVARLALAPFGTEVVYGGKLARWCPACCGSSLAAWSFASRPLSPACCAASPS